MDVTSFFHKKIIHVPPEGSYVRMATVCISISMRGRKEILRERERVGPRYDYCRRNY